MSVVISTYNNAISLAETLESIIAQINYDANFVEILIVDNNSSDNTKEIVNQFECRIPCKMVYLFEGLQGLSNARNAGVKYATGEYVLFTDDDASLPDNWLQQYARQISLNRPDCLFSKIEVIWDRPKPWWYLPEHAPQFCAIDHGNEVIVVTDLSHEFFGKNFCLRKSLIEEYGGFDPKLGRSGSNLVAGEETLIFRRLIREDRKIIYFPSACVGHRLKAREYEVANIEKAYRDSAYATLHFARIFSTKKFFGRPIGLIFSSTRAVACAILKLGIAKFYRDKPFVLLQKLTIKKNIMIIRLWLGIVD